MRPDRTSLAVALAGLLAVVAGCGAGSGAAPSPPSGQSGAPSGQSGAPSGQSGAPSGQSGAPSGIPAAQPPLVGTEWELRGLLRDGEERPAPAAAQAAVLRLDRQGGISGIDGCNRFGGEVRIAGPTLEIGQLMRTDIACGRDELPRAFTAVLAGRVSWAVRDGALWLTKPGGHGLVFAGKPSIYPEGDLTPLLQGRREGGDYRFGWSTRDGLVAVEWNWRDGPGKPWVTASATDDIGRPAARPDPLSASAGRAVFVLGLIRAGAARVVYQPPGAGRATPLQVFPLPGVASLKAYGGFVDAPRRGALVIAYRADGSELSRSVPVR